MDKHFRAIAEETGITVEEVKSAIAVLERPDIESRSPDSEGRRIVRIDDHRTWGWQVVNFLKYRGIRDEETRRETWRKSQAKRRASQHPSTPVNTSHPPSTHTDTEADTERALSRSLRGERDGYADRMPKDTAEHMLALESRVQSLRAGWKTALSYAEQQALLQNARCLDSLTDENWDAIRAYLAAKLPEGMPGWQPKSRQKFIESAPDVWNYAGEWAKKNGTAPKPKNEGIWK